MNAPAPNQFFVVKAKDHHQLLENLQDLSKKLDQMVRAEVISSYSSIHQWIPSISQQKSAYELIGKKLLNSNFKLFQDTGLLDQQQIKTIRKQYQDANNQFLTVDQWLASPLGQKLSYLWLGKIDDEYATIG